MEKPQTDLEFFELLNRWWDAGFMKHLNLPAHLHARFDIPKAECIRIFDDWWRWQERQSATLNKQNTLEGEK